MSRTLNFSSAERCPRNADQQKHNITGIYPNTDEKFKKFFGLNQAEFENFKHWLVNKHFELLVIKPRVTEVLGSIRNRSARGRYRKCIQSADDKWSFPDNLFDRMSETIPDRAIVAHGVYVYISSHSNEEYLNDVLCRRRAEEQQTGTHEEWVDILVMNNDESRIDQKRADKAAANLHIEELLLMIARKRKRLEKTKFKLKEYEVELKHLRKATD